LDLLSYTSFDKKVAIFYIFFEKISMLKSSFFYAHLILLHLFARPKFLYRGLLQSLNLGFKPAILKSYELAIYGWFGLNCLNCQSQNSPKLTSNDSLRALYQHKFDQYLPKEPSVKNFVAISDTGIALYASPEARAKNQFEYSLNWQQIDHLSQLFKNRHFALKTAYESGNLLNLRLDSTASINPSKVEPLPNKPLLGWRIALDPGHFAGNLATAKIEGKFIEMNLAKGLKISFFESELAWYTAQILQKKLSDLGASVLLTRSQFGHTAFGYSFDDWYEKYQKNQSDSGKTALNKPQAFVRRFFRPELNERARLINDFRPHLTLIIHYNVEANNSGWSKPVASNQSMAFVGGAFQAKELNLPENRFHLLRMLLTDEIEQSSQFSAVVLQKIAEKLGIQATQEPNNQGFLQETSLPINQAGVYARNLTLTRQVWGTLCYVEPLFQDNEKECKLLNRRDLNFEGRKIPRRLEAVAEAYLQAILAYAQKK
jgi:N-acetylmuramoyl-L-alanine amidase